MEPCCGVCRLPATNRKLRKTILGQSAAGSISILVAYASEHFPGCDLKSTLESLTPNQAYLCNMCEQLVNRYPKLVTELQAVTKELDQKLKVLLQSERQPTSSRAPTQTTPVRQRQIRQSPAVAVSTY